MATLPTLTAYDPNLIPNKATMTDEEFADAIHPYLNFWNGTTIPEINNWSPILEQIRQEINDKYIAVKNQAVDGGYSQAYLDTKYNPPMSRTYYVDAVNGDDVNDGSGGSPFKTIKKAIDSVPIGGYGSIRILSNEINIENDITLYNKYIYISGSSAPSSSALIKNISYTDNYGNATTGFVLQNSVLEIYRCTIQTANWADSSQGDSFYQGFIKRRSSHSSVVKLSGTSVLLGDTPFARIDFNTPHGVDIQMRYRNGYGDYAQNYSISCNGANKNGVFLYIEEGTTRLSVSGISLGKKIDGSDLSWDDLVVGIVRDTDGKSRNILSNIVL